jgi:hypothetical protein
MQGGGGGSNDIKEIYLQLVENKLVTAYFNVPLKLYSEGGGSHGTCGSVVQ